jgi:hypothetical protein
VVARIEEDALVVDLRTIDPGDDQALAGALEAAMRCAVS